MSCYPKCNFCSNDLPVSGWHYPVIGECSCAASKADKNRKKTEDEKKSLLQKKQEESCCSKGSNIQILSRHHAKCKVCGRGFGG